MVKLNKRETPLHTLQEILEMNNISYGSDSSSNVPSFDDAFNTGYSEKGRCEFETTDISEKDI